jgi:catalase
MFKAAFFAYVIGMAFSATALHAASTPAPPTDEELPAALVQDLHATFGEHHARAVHAKGIVLDGSFKPSAEAAYLSMAALFTAGAAVTVRFSDFTGLPEIPDTSPLASPRGLAVKFTLADGSTMDIVSHSFNGFPVATAREFGDFLLAIAQSGPDAAKPTALDKYLAGHPIALTFLTTQKPAPESYATVAYFGVNAFAFIDVQGKRSIVRYRFIPRAGEHYLDAGATAGKGPNYLSEEIAGRVGQAPVIFDWLAQIAEGGDKADDPSIAWPENRKLVNLGSITITRLTADQAEADKSLLFLPATVPDGIEVADPMLDIRNAAYAISFGERQ